MSSHFADEASQLPLDYLRGLMCISKDVSVDEQYRGELGLESRGGGEEVLRSAKGEKEDGIRELLCRLRSVTSQRQERL